MLSQYNKRYPASIISPEKINTVLEKKDIKEFQAKQEKSAAITSMGTLGEILKAKMKEKAKK